MTGDFTEAQGLVAKVRSATRIGYEVADEVVMWLMLIAACTKSEVDPQGDPPGTGWVGSGLANPFPNVALLDDAGQLDLFGVPDVTTTPIPVDRLAYRTGFSPAQNSVLRLEGIDPSDLPSAGDVRPGEGSVRMVDLTDGTPWPCMAELDAYPNADEVALIVRPLQAVPLGHRVGVAVLTSAVERPERFDRLMQGAPPSDLAPYAQATTALVQELAAAGVPEAEIAVAWEYPVGDGTTPLRSALSQLQVPTSHAFTRVRDLDIGDTVAPSTWRTAEGTFEVQQFLIDDQALDLAADGSVGVLGTTDAYLYVHVPTSVRDAPAGSVPVLVFGHGIFGQPSFYLDDEEDPSAVLQLADEAGFVVIATNWRGLTYDDRNVPILVATDFGRFPELTDLLVQGQANTRALIDYAEQGELFDDPLFVGDSAQALVDRSRIFYYGISLGAIEGAVLLAQDPPIDAAVLHVGGATWSTMLERSSHWSAFELLMAGAVPSAADRQVLYALSQLWWDAVDPIAYVPELSARAFLLQESVGDEQVPNLTTEVLARSIALPLLDPSDTVPWGLTSVDGPLPPGSRALVRFDPMLPLPVSENRPAAVSGAHETPRKWDGTRLQVIDHLLPGAEGQVVHHCGGEICSATNEGGAR